MTDRPLATAHPQTDRNAPLVAQFLAESEKKQLQLVPELLEQSEAGWDALMGILDARRSESPTLVDAKIYQSLYCLTVPHVREFLQSTFPHGLLPLKSDRGIDYRLLQDLLAKQDFQTADSLTRQKFCELAGEAAIARKWVYFTEVERFPSTDILTIDRLWWLHSEGKFGFSVQRKLWLSLGKDFTKLWPKIDWKSGNSWTKYPNGFTWDLSAPPGHLPLLNQLRGVRVAAALYNHPAWSESTS